MENSLICGIDEAGRGPVIGPLVIAGVVISEKNLFKLTELDVRDSKLISPNRREELFEEILKVVDDYHIIEISPREIDTRKAIGTNLNQLEAIKAAEIITNLEPTHVFVDSPEPADSQKFGRMIMKYLDDENKPEISAEHKADLNHRVVAAASILAKVTRDRAIQEIQKLCSISFGSGYPSDPICQKFLETGDLDEIDDHIRKCWFTYQQIKQKKEQSSLGDF